jgi:hypothetical protein
VPESASAASRRPSTPAGRIESIGPLHELALNTIQVVAHACAP